LFSGGIYQQPFAVTYIRTNLKKLYKTAETIWGNNIHNQFITSGSQQRISAAVQKGLASRLYLPSFLHGKKKKISGK